MYSLMTSKVLHHPPSVPQTRRETQAREANTEIPKEESFTECKVTWKVGVNELGKSLYSCGCDQKDPQAWDSQALDIFPGSPTLHNLC